MIQIKGNINFLAEAGTHLWFITVAYRFHEQILEADAIKHFTKNVKYLALECFTDHLKLFKQAEIDITFTSLLGDKVPEMTDLLLANTMNTPEALFEAVGVPGQVVVHHQIGILKVDAFTSRIGCNKDTDIGVRAKEFLCFPAVVTVNGTMNDNDSIMTAKHTGNFFMQVVQRIAVLTENDNFAHPPSSIAHLGFVLENAREFIPLAILAGCNQTFCLLLKSLENEDFTLQLCNGL